MRLGIFGGDTANRTIDDVVADARKAGTDGFASYWLPQIFGMDAISVLAIVGREVPRIELGTAVVPTYPRHPMMLAQQARTEPSASPTRRRARSCSRSSPPGCSSSRARSATEPSRG